MCVWAPVPRLVAVRSLQRLGENETLCKIIMKLANSELGEGRVGLLATVMGALRHPDFFAYLKGAIAKVRSDLEERPILDALGRIGTPEAAKVPDRPARFGHRQDRYQGRPGARARNSGGPG